ncbi:MAG TPA: phage portal protein [Actinophytocola sp.]|jgi:HK97 family phage portal protein|nr:phage portal protein [Actinophytocola sp.]
MKPWLLPASRPAPVEPASVPPSSPGTELSYPVGRAVVEPFDKAHGHDDSQFVPEEYGNYLATSNEIYSAAQLRARLMGTVPMRLFKGRTEDKRAMPDHPASKLLDFVNPHWTPARLARMDELSMCLFGESVWAIHRENGVPKEIWWLKPSRLLPVPDEEDYLSGYLYESQVNGQIIRFDADEIVWFRYPNPLDEFSAFSPISAARLAADTASAMMQANRNLHKQGVQIAGMVTPKGDRVRYTPDQARELADDLQTRFAGAKNAHRWAVLRYEAEFHPVTFSPKDAEFVLGLGLTLRQVCNAYGVPSPLLNDLEHATLANVREFQLGLWEHALVPDSWLKAQEIEEQYLPKFPGFNDLPDYVEPNFDHVAALQVAKSATWDRDRQALEVGALTINEWRRKQGLPAVPWGDAFWAPVNKAPVEDAKALPPAAGDGEESAAGPSPVEDAQALSVRINAAGILIRSGFDAKASMRALKLPEIEYLPVRPVTVQPIAAAEGGETDPAADPAVPDGAPVDPPDDPDAEPPDDPPDDAPAEDAPEVPEELAAEALRWARVLAAMETELSMNGHGGH